MLAKYQFSIGLGLFLTGLMIGKFALVTPMKTTETKTIQVQQDQTKQDKTHVTKTLTRRPDGTVTVITETKKDVKTETEVSKDSQAKTVVEPVVKDWVISGFVTSYRLGDLGYGVSVTRRVIGPVMVGVLGSSTGTLGLTVGLEF